MIIVILIVIILTFTIVIVITVIRPPTNAGTMWSPLDPPPQRAATHGTPNLPTKLLRLSLLRFVDSNLP